MQREILFRAKRKDNGEWVYGFYYKAKFYATDKELCDYITTPYPDEEGRRSDHFMIDPETLGRYTGLTDKNGKKIFEGDIVKIYPDCDYPEDFDISKVYSYNGVLCVDYHTSEYDATAIGFAYDIDETEFEVIGNIHDNPELWRINNDRIQRAKTNSTKQPRRQESWYRL